MLGPVLLESASVDQIREHLPKIVAGEIRWCQGYSEPGSGSDLASLSTRAELHGDTYTINGSKVWTSYADQADWIFCLVRTDFEVPKHAGISFILFDMASPGITTTPIQLISGCFQGLQHRAATMYTEIELCKSVVRAALAGLDEPGKSRQEIAVLASIATA